MSLGGTIILRFFPAPDPIPCSIGTGRSRSSFFDLFKAAIRRSRPRRRRGWIG